MRYGLAGLLAAFLFLQTHGPEPPEGWFCTHDTHAPEDHQCACVRTCSRGEDGTLIVTEDAKCKVYCYKDHCTCKPKGCEQT